MNLFETIEKDLIQAVKNGREETRDVLRFLKSSILKREKELQTKLTDDELINLIGKEIKLRKDAIEQFIQGSRQDLAEADKKGIEILEKYMPEQLSSEEIKKIVIETIDEIKAKSITEMGQVMNKVMAKAQGKADGSKISQIVREHLSK